MSNQAEKDVNFWQNKLTTTALQCFPSFKKNSVVSKRVLCIQWWTHFVKNWCVFQLVSNVLCKSQFFKTFNENLLLFSRFKIVALPWEAENVFISFSWHVCFDWPKPSKAKCKQRRIVIWLVEKTIFVAVFVFRIDVTSLLSQLLFGDANWLKLESFCVKNWKKKIFFWFFTSSFHRNQKNCLHYTNIVVRRWWNW